MALGVARVATPAHRGGSAPPRRRAVVRARSHRPGRAGEGRARIGARSRRGGSGRRRARAAGARRLASEGHAMTTHSAARGSRQGAPDPREAHAVVLGGDGAVLHVTPGTWNWLGVDG